MERLLPDVEYHIHLHHHQKHKQLNENYSNVSQPMTDVSCIKQEPETVLPFTQQCSESVTGQHSFNSRAIVQVSYENQHDSAGTNTTRFFVSTVSSMKHIATTGANESLNRYIDRNALVNQHAFTNMAYSANSGSDTGPYSSSHQSSDQHGCHQISGSLDLHFTAEANTRTISKSAQSVNTSCKPTRNGFPRYCGVCGDVAKSYHFGGLSCDSCKAFFRRSVHNDNYLHFQCYHNGQCSITVSNRKSCQYCRMKRCLGIGMEKSWVMTEDERKALIKTRTENRLKKQLAATASLANSKNACKESQQSLSVLKLSKELKLENYEPQVDRMIEYLSIVEIKEIESVVTRYVSAFQQVPYRDQLLHFNENRPGFQVMEMFGTLIRRFAVYAKMMGTFTSLSCQDQKILLKGGVLEMCILRGAHIYDPTANRWPRSDVSVYKNTPTLKLENITKLTTSLVFRKHMEFVSFIQQLHLDEPSVMLLVLIVLFSKRDGLSQSEEVEKTRAFYISLLERYMGWRFGQLCSKAMLQQLLAKLNDLRSLSEVHNKENMRLGKDEFSSIQQQLQHIKINPYAKINVVQEDHSDTNECEELIQQYQDTPSPSLADQALNFLQTMPLTSDVNSITNLSSQIAAGNHPLLNVPQASNKLIEPASILEHCSQQSWHSASQQQSPPLCSEMVEQVTQQPETREMQQYTAFGATTPKSIKHILENTTSFLSSRSDSSCSSNFNSKSSAANPSISDFREKEFLGQSSLLFDNSLANERAHSSTQQHDGQLTEHLKLTFANLDCKADGLVEADNVAQALYSSGSPFDDQLSSSSVTGNTSLRFSRIVDCHIGGNENLPLSNKELTSENAVTDLSSLTPTATVALFNELERYSDLYHY